MNCVVFVCCLLFTLGLQTDAVPVSPPFLPGMCRMAVPTCNPAKCSIPLLGKRIPDESNCTRQCVCLSVIQYVG
uniref:Antimicrobial peptide n=1 Tax=Euperipatoides rowelli TaxID=49087 RepID=D9IX80_EUPRO|nr:antimicrobial peptide [Euperipatoides rowelli]